MTMTESGAKINKVLTSFRTGKLTDWQALAEIQYIMSDYALAKQNESIDCVLRELRK